MGCSFEFPPSGLRANFSLATAYIIGLAISMDERTEACTTSIITSIKERGMIRIIRCVNDATKLRDFLTIITSLKETHMILAQPRDASGIKGVETISLDLSKLKRVCFNSNVFAKMTRLRLLKVHSNSYVSHTHEDIQKKYYDDVIKDASKIQFNLDFEFLSYEIRYLYWNGYPLDFLLSNFNGENLVELHLKCNNIKQLWQGNKYLESLKVIDLSCSKKLIQMSEFLSMPNFERLILGGCASMIDIHPSVGVLKKLTTLNLTWCDKLMGLPSSINNLESLEILDLSFCSKFKKFPEKERNMKSLKALRLMKTAIKDLPNSITDLESLEIRDVSYYSKCDKFPEKGGNMKSLKVLQLKNTAIKDLLDSIRDLESLEILDLSDCSKFEKFSRYREKHETSTQT
ncbi:hypothetical protein PVL29_015985 [Vitis rotundifolia]|uniref:Uncharacterized protein n=1 Tax=Vitis rotundifolia TaxID=103349 RepID=A0AA38ZF57_VITRO|nr:hypothetical protein PVL29_015985 [Vitis rotundifolia]